MHILSAGRLYEMQQLGGGVQQLWVRGKPPQEHGPIGAAISLLAKILIKRTQYLDQVLPCEETRSALWFLAQVFTSMRTTERYAYAGKVVEVMSGHVYTIYDPQWFAQTIVFVRRSGGAIRYKKGWAGVQSQELIRVMIATLKSSNIGNLGLRKAWINDLRQVLFFYEARALRRKSDQVNRQSGAHDSSERLRSWRAPPFEDIPFDVEEIELRAVGEDGHITLSEEEAEWLRDYHLGRIARRTK